jgi:hypothetical protein
MRIHLPADGTFTLKSRRPLEVNNYPLQADGCILAFGKSIHKSEAVFS